MHVYSEIVMLFVVLRLLLMNRSGIKWNGHQHPSTPFPYFVTLFKLELIEAVL